MSTKPRSRKAPTVNDTAQTPPAETAAPITENTTPSDATTAPEPEVDTSIESDPTTTDPTAADGVIVSTATADVGAEPVAQIDNAAEAFATAIQTRAYEQKLLDLGIEGYSTALQDALIKIFENPDASPATKSILQFFLKYSAEMSANSPVGGGIGEALQRRFFHEFTVYANVGAPDFRLGMSVLLTIVKESADKRGGFYAHLPFRFLPNVALNDDNVKSLEAIMHLLTTTADVSMRRVAMKAINLERCLRYGFSPEGKQRLTQFYQL